MEILQENYNFVVGKVTRVAVLVQAFTTLAPHPLLLTDGPKYIVAQGYLRQLCELCTARS